MSVSPNGMAGRYTRVGVKRLGQSVPSTIPNTPTKATITTRIRKSIDFSTRLRCLMPRATPRILHGTRPTAWRIRKTQSGRRLASVERSWRVFHSVRCHQVGRGHASSPYSLVLAVGTDSASCDCSGDPMAPGTELEGRCTQRGNVRYFFCGSSVENGTDTPN
jgi:hypothetical protein